MRSLRSRWRLFALLVILAPAGCSGGGRAIPDAPQAASSPSPPGPVEHRVMRLPAQLDPQQPPSSAAERSTGVPSLPVTPGGEHAREFALNLATGLSELFHDAASRVVPAVVTIRTISRSGTEPDEDSSDPLRNLIGGEEVVRESLGSGVLIDAAGIVMTNYHVVRAKGRTTVELHDGRQFEIAATKADPHTDLAVVQLKNAAGLPFAQLGDSDSLKVGDWVLAVGSQLGLEATVTAGIISAKGRGLGHSSREEFLQTDAPINPGSSGGPLVNLRGEVVGINTAISSTTGGYQGIGFTIPIKLAKWVGQQLIENGKVRWAYLGVTLRKVTPEIARRAGTGGTSGLVVLAVHRGSPAAEGGIRPGDVITRFDEEEMSDPYQLQSALEGNTIGTQHSLTVIREGQPRTIRVTVAEQPPERRTERRTPVEDELDYGATQAVVR